MHGGFQGALNWAPMMSRDTSLRHIWSWLRFCSVFLCICQRAASFVLHLFLSSKLFPTLPEHRKTFLFFSHRKTKKNFVKNSLVYTCSFDFCGFYKRFNIYRTHKENRLTISDLNQPRYQILCLQYLRLIWNKSIIDLFVVFQIKRKMVNTNQFRSPRVRNLAASLAAINKTSQ